LALPQEDRCIAADASSDTLPHSHDRRNTTNRQAIIHYIQRAEKATRHRTGTTNDEAAAHSERTEQAATDVAGATPYRSTLSGATTSFDGEASITWNARVQLLGTKKNLLGSASPLVRSYD
jgi:hypothetical protein